MFNDSQESNIILQGVLLTGIRDIKFDSSVNESSTKLLGNRGITRKIYGPHKTTCSFSKPYNGKDYIQSLTGVPNLSGQFVYKNNSLEFSDAAISSYGLNLDSDGFGEISVTIQIFGDIKPTTNLQQLSSAAQDFPILDKTPTIAFFDLDNKNSAIKTLSYEASLNPQSSINIGSANSSNVDFVSPVVHRISTDIEMLEQEVEDVTGFAENSKLTKNIDIVFASESDKLSIDRISAIRQTVKEIESEGINTDDLDFSMGTCALNTFEFKEASISSQNLNAKAGEVVQLNNVYNAYSNIEKITGSIPVPSSFSSCADHLQKLEDNLLVALGRSNLQLTNDIIDFETMTSGPTDLNVTRINFTFGERSTGEDFELETTGEQYITNMYLLFNADEQIEFEGFEAQNEGITGLNVGAIVNIEDFEDQNEGITGLSEDLQIYPDNTVNFENLETGFQLSDSTISGEILEFVVNIEAEDFESENIGFTQNRMSEDLQIYPPDTVDFENLNEGLQLSDSNISGEILPFEADIEAEDFELSGEGFVSSNRVVSLSNIQAFNIQDFETEFSPNQVVNLISFANFITIDEEDFEGFEAGANSTNLYSF